MTKTVKLLTYDLKKKVKITNDINAFRRHHATCKYVEIRARN